MNYELPKNKINFQVLQKIIKSNILLYCIVLLLVLKIISVGISVNFPNNIFFADITRVALENLANQTRQSFGLAPLAESQKLDQVAQMKAEDMVKKQYFDHTSPTGITPWFWFSQAGYNYKYAGENLAIGFFDSEEVYNAWLNSPAHKANIINPNYKEFGTAVMSGYGNNNTIVVVQEFGSQIKNSLNVNNQEVNVKKPVNVEKPVNNVGVLSQSAEIQPVNSVGTNGTYSKTMNFVVYNYEGMLQNIIYGVSLVVAGILLAMIFFGINGEILKKQLVFRSILIAVLLSLSLFFNKEMIFLFISHKVII